MSPRKRSLVAALGVALIACRSAALAADAEPMRLDLRDPAWELAGDGTLVEEFDGRLALRLQSGSATRRDVRFLDGTIEFDLQVTPYRAFAYVYFRMESDDEHEEFYFRPHKSLLPDAIQYSPVYKGSSQWQLYHDGRSTAAAPMPPGRWIPVKVVVQGSRAAVFVGATEEPQLVVPRLARDAKSGYFALRSFLPLGTPEGTYVANFANVVVRPGVVAYEFPAEEPPPTLPDDQITTWHISPVFAPAAGPLTELPPGIVGRGGWQTVTTNADGLLELERYVTRPEGVRRAGVLAMLRIPTSEPVIRRLDLGYSDEISIFVNARPVVVDDESYSYNLPRRQGLVTGDQLSVFLPLERGVNEVALAIVDRFGGWGLSGRLGPPIGPAGTAGTAAPAADAASGGELGRLAWMAGCWLGEAGEECWLAPRGGMMLGVNRGPDREGKTPFFELLRVVEDEEGLVLLAQPVGQSPAVPFRAIEVGDGRIVFANPEHDFPQRITYSREGDTMKARVEAQQDGEWRGFDQIWSPGSWAAD